MPLPDLKDSLLRRSRDLGECTGRFLDTIQALRTRGQKDVETIWNAAFHVNVVDHDISSFLYFHTTIDDVWAQRSVARVIATLLYEGIEDLSALYGKPFMDACREAGIYSEIEADFKTTKKKLSDFSRQNRSFLKDIRVRAGAHKEQDAIEFITAVIQAEDGKMIELACEFSAILVEFGRFSSSVIEKANAEYRRKGMIP